MVIHHIEEKLKQHENFKKLSEKERIIIWERDRLTSINTIVAMVIFFIFTPYSPLINLVNLVEEGFRISSLQILSSSFILFSLQFIFNFLFFIFTFYYYHFLFRICFNDLYKKAKKIDKKINGKDNRRS